MSLFSALIRLTLTPYERARFLSPEGAGHVGGPGVLWHRLYAGFDLDGNTLSIEDDTLVRVNRYAYAYGSGGYQNAFRSVIAAANRAGWEAPDSVNDVRGNQDAEGRRWSGR